MLKELLAEEQPVVYRALKTAAEENRISSAYLFTGPAGTPKHEAAVLLAETIFCSEHGLACESCETCRRVREGLYADFRWIDGSAGSISKETVDALQADFAKTAIEEGSGQKVYVLENAENMSISAQNSILKFLEEPSEGVTAILTTDNIHRLLPTIISRCTMIPFVPLSAEERMKKAADEGIDEDDAYFLSQLGRNAEEMKTLCESDMYRNALEMLKQYLNLSGMRRNELAVDFEFSWKSRLSSRDAAKKENMFLIGAFLDLLSLYAHDVILHHEAGPAWYRDAVMNAQGKAEDYAGWIMIAKEQRDRVNKYNDLNLVLAQTIYRLEEYNRDHRI